MRQRLPSEPLRRRGAGGPTEFRRLRAGVLRLGTSLGLDTQAVVRFSEAISGQRWRRCQGYDMEQAVGELSQIGRRIRPTGEAEWRIH
jgi:hypothetical protein